MKLAQPTKQYFTRDSHVKPKYDIRFGINNTIDCMSRMLGIYPANYMNLT